MTRTYLDHNATTPLRPEARAAMIAAMDVAGNPSSVHAEGRVAKGLLENARAQIAALVGCKVNQVVLTSGATEAAALAVAQKHRHGGCFAALPTEHDAVAAWSEITLPALHGPDGAEIAGGLGAVLEAALDQPGAPDPGDGTARALLLALSAANSETGVLGAGGRVPGSGAAQTPAGRMIAYSTLADITQICGKMPVRFDAETPSYAILSAHKLGGPKGVGALINFTADDPAPLLRGGGQEMGRRSGTENLIGIAGFGAAAEAAARDVAGGRWQEVEELRNILETALEAGAKLPIFVGKGATRLPNTSCIIAEGWKGETQVMQMDLSGFAVSAGSACSSGKVRASKVLQAMGYNDTQAASAIRVSLGLDTTKEDVLRFAESWLAKRQKHEKRAA